MKARYGITLSVLMLASVPLLGACKREGPGETAGKKIDRAVEDVKDKLDPPGPLEKAGKKIDRAVEDAAD